MKLKVKAVVTGLSTYIPGYNYMRPTGGTGSARYCYSVWLRHLVLVHKHGRLTGVPKIVAELGPGDSIGIGLAALLSGVDKYYAFDLVRYSNLTSNLAIFDELVQLFRRREAIPGEDEFPLVHPKLDSYEFPDELLKESLKDALLPERVDEIRLCIERIGDASSRITYHAPWTDASVIQQGSVDMIYSQAVLEHVDDLPAVYWDMRRWLKPMGVMSHQIDFKCHGKADTWNGHWTYSDFVWKIVVGRRPYLLNRVPHSEHLRLISEKGFDVALDKAVHSKSTLRRQQLARRFRELSESDLTTSGSYIVAVAPG
jgi:hypothetical protein